MIFLQRRIFNGWRDVVVVERGIFCLGGLSFTGPGKRAGTGFMVGGLAKITE